MYINLCTGEIVADGSAYNYAKLQLDTLDPEGKKMFVEWFYNSKFYNNNWLHRTKEQIEEELALGGVGAYCIDKLMSKGGSIYG